MTSPYSSNLLQHPADGPIDEPAFSAPRPFSSPTEPVEPVTTPAYPYEQHAQPRLPRTAPRQQPPVQREVVRYVQQQAPVQYAPQPVYVDAPAPKTRGGGFGTALVMGLVVILLGAVALVGGYYVTRQASPSQFEASTQVGLASDFGFQQGRLRGMQSGHQAAVELGATTSRLSASLARQKAYEQAYANGLKAGNVLPRATYGRGYYGGGYRGPRISYPRISQTTQALGVAQNLANQTGAPVDVEIYGG